MGYLTNKYHTAGAFALPSLKFKQSIVRIFCLKALPQALNGTSFIKPKPLEMYLPCSLVQKVMGSFYSEIKSLPSVYFVACLINRL